MSRFHSLEIVDRRQETADSVSLAFAVPESLRGAFAFQPGQYLTVRVTIDGEECRRSYSICSGADEGELRIAIRAVEGGRFSRFAAESLGRGARLDVAPPEGRFTAEIGADRHYAFFAAGSGITPVISIVRSTLAADARARATLVYGNRTSASIMFREALDDLKDRYLGRLAVFHVLSRERQAFDLLNGRIDGARVALFARTIVAPADVDAWFLCGPFGMIEDGRTALLAAGVEPSRIKAERFSTDGALPPAPGPAPARAGHEGEAQVDCILEGRSRRIAVEPGRLIIEAAHGQGFEIPHSCKGGMCCTCRCKVLAGAVAMDVNYSLEPWELEAGFVLACQSRPLTPAVTLDFDAA
ncbi:ring-1,2-phenylacetyl-CoA epoxidase subunit PaaE [Roseiarcus fermentans]|uniref:Ring-1,2-phenylacetyl-CoA epoxidase subunit PaaE n=1 Tax=Roseiarcus fermentans TaxID=1473586 RepID=A0A366FDK2_9HYPH|nr:2Fe-2S iron-sulfur cluster-binding protein [Roseiarcus fermentans]RBP12020.1 ring-1,2-phenylacetyl-CoA epoxidase subunit PaaE [Roseiarcus fermentans]